MESNDFHVFRNYNIKLNLYMIFSNGFICLSGYDLLIGRLSTDLSRQNRSKLAANTTIIIVSLKIQQTKKSRSGFIYINGENHILISVMKNKCLLCFLIGLSIKHKDLSVMSLIDRLLASSSIIKQMIFNDDKLKKYT